MTRIYHLVHFSYDDSVYAYFKGCNFECKGCIVKVSPWDIHLPPEIRIKLPSIENCRTLSLSDLENLMKSSNLNIKRAVLTGGDPTIDRALPNIVKLFTNLGMETVLFTNGDLLHESLVRMLEEAGLDEVYVSIKAYTDSVHEAYTGHSNKRSLENFKLLEKSKIKLRAGTILIPKLIEEDEIERLAKFISSVDPNIPLRIAGYVQVPGTPWRSPTKGEMIEVAQTARKYLKNVHYTHSGMNLKGEFKVLHPKVLW